MICTQCHEPFEGVGMYCPRCTTIAVTQRSVQRNVFLSQTPDLALAPKLDRLLALFVDAIVSSIFVFVGTLLALASIAPSDYAAYTEMIGSYTRGIQFVPTNLQLIIATKVNLAIYIPFFVFDLLYYSLLESSVAQGTFGKILFGLRVTDLEGHRISLGRAIGRYVSRYIFILPVSVFAWVLTTKNFVIPNVETAIYISALFTFLGLAATSIFVYVPILVTSRSQGVHDLLAGTMLTHPYPISSGRYAVGFMLAVAGFIGCLVVRM